MSERINEGLPEGATELSPDDLVGLIPDYIDTRENLNQFEKSNIQNALQGNCVDPSFPKRKWTTFPYILRRTAQCLRRRFLFMGSIQRRVSVAR